MFLTLELKKKEFDKLWLKYPNKDGKKQAWGYYNNSVKTSDDVLKINTALNNYIAHLKQEDWKKPKNGSTWFNNWQDWTKRFTANELVKPVQSQPHYLTPEERQDCKMRFSAEFQYKLQLRFRDLWRLSQRLVQLKNAPPNMW